MFETTVVDGVCRFERPGTTWLSTGPVGGRFRADAAYNCTVPDPWEPTAIDAYVADRLARAGFDDEPGPTLLTGVDQAHARGARCGPVTAVATAGVTNPASLPPVPTGGSLPTVEPLEASASGTGGDGAGSGVDGAGETATDTADETATDATDDTATDATDDTVTDATDETETEYRPGTVNVLVGTTRALDSGALANLVAVTAEAKAATVLAATGFTGTTTDAVIVGCDPTGPEARFTGSATPVGAATRACVRESVTAALGAWVADGGSVPDSVESASYGISTDVRADVFSPGE